MTTVFGARVGADVTAQVDQLFAAAHRDLMAPGIAYGVVGGGGLLHAGGVGQTSTGGPLPLPDSVFRIASMTKSFTAACVILLRDEGLLTLDDPVDRYVPQLAGLVLPTADSPPLTIRSLLTMSGGLPTDDPWADRQESMSAAELDVLLAGGLTFVEAPDTRFEYSNLGYVILGRVVANVTGSPLTEVVRSRLLRPLGMSRTGFATTEVPATALVTGHHRCGNSWVAEPFSGPGEFSALGGLFSTVEDIATWVTGLAAAFPPRDDPEDGHPLSRASRRAMQQQQRAIDPKVTLSMSGDVVHLDAAGYGYGLVVEQHPRWGTIVSHSGGYPGFGSHMRWHPATGLGVVALGNSRYARVHQPATAALAAVLASVGAPSHRVRPLPAVVVAQKAVEALVRSWDDAAADALFASNVDLDLPRAERRAAVEAAVVAVGGLAPDDVTVPARPWADSAAHLVWTVPGRAGRLEVEVRLTPTVPPVVQTLVVTAEPDPSPVLARVRAQLGAALLATPPTWPATVPTGPDVDVATLVDTAAVASALGSPFTVPASPARADSPRAATWTLESGRGAWRLSIGVDDAGVVTRCALTPAGAHADDHVELDQGPDGPTTPGAGIR